MQPSAPPPAYNEVAMTANPSTYGHRPHQPQTAASYQNYYTQPSAAGHPADTAVVMEEETVAPSTVGHDWAGDSFSNKKIRLAFIRKVYLILMVQLAATVGIICLFIFYDPLKKWVQDHSWFYWISYGVFIVTYIVLICCSNVRRRFPANFICLTIFTLALAFVAATISSYYDTDIVLIAMGITAGVCLAISIFAVQTKIDFTVCGGLLFALCMILLFSGIICLVFWQTKYYHYLHCLYGALAAVVFSLLLIYDTQRVVGGKNRRYQLSPEEYIAGALELYLDIVYLFMIILSCFGNS